MDDSLNVFDEGLVPCGTNPVTGFYRDGCCNTSDEDMRASGQVYGYSAGVWRVLLQARVAIDLNRGSLGSHTVCIQADERFLQYSRFRGNDLSTPMLDFGFPGLNPGGSWCLCAARWLEAYEQDMPPKVYLTRTHKRALERVSIDKLKEFAADLN